MRLTKGMLDAMLDAVAFFQAGEGPAEQGLCSEAEESVILRNAAKAKEWIHEQLDKRAAASKRKGGQ